MRDLVRELALDGAAWRTKDDFYADLLPVLGAPSWHGRNLDALNDSLAGGDINAVNPPFVISVRGVAEMGAEARSMVDRFADLIRHLKARGVDVDIIIEGSSA